MTLLLRCGCQIAFREDAAVRCPAHGLVGVARVLGAPAPRIRGTATGPHVQPEDLAPFRGRLVPETKES